MNMDEIKKKFLREHLLIKKELYKTNCDLKGNE